jgi:signal transduction histidine kinase
MAVVTSRVRDGAFRLRSVPFRRGLNVVWLALVAALSTPELHIRDSPRGLANLALLVVAGATWLYALVWRPDTREQGRLVTLVIMTLAGAAMIPSAPEPLVFPGVGLMVLATRWNVATSAVATALATLGTLLANIDESHVLTNILGTLAVSLAGATVGSARRQSVESERREAAVELERVRADLEHGRAELLEQRSHLAREIHDVLAHTLAALSVQLEALSAVIDTDAPSRSELAEPLDRAKRLVRDGIGEVRGAIATLRDDPTPLDERVAKMSAERGATFSLEGTPRPLDPKTAITVFRVVQEALTNAIKHAPGTPISVGLAYGDAQVTATIENPLAGADGRPSASGNGGYGLVGMRERAAELGGSVRAAREDNVWRVVVSVPAPR